MGLSPCRETVHVALARRELTSLDLGAPTRDERTLSRSLEHGAWLSSKRRFSGAHLAMALNGYEPEYLLKYQLKRELLFFAAKLTGESSLRRAATTLTRGATLRALIEMEALERSRARATYVQIEEWRGYDVAYLRANIRPPDATFATIGAALLGTGAVLRRVTPLPIQPQMWPPGIQVSGTFSIP